jgi:Arc/MetJ-type ribon-helix-helix transcriptional regulator
VEVKTVTKSISLNQDLADFASQEAEEGGYGNVSAYFAELVRQRRQAQIDSDTQFLAEAVKDAPPGPEPVHKIAAACRAARQQMRRQKWVNEL